MNSVKVFLTAVTCLAFTSIGFALSFVFYPPSEKLHNYHTLTSVIDDEQYVVFKTKDSDDWSILRPSGDIVEHLTHSQVGEFFCDDETDWENSIENPDNEEFLVEVAFNLGKDVEDVTQAEFDARYGR
jgi:hypothetical protein